jgi:hypothetical protein
MSWERLASLEAIPKTPVQPEIAAEHTCRILLAFRLWADDGKLLPNPVKEELPTNRELWRNGSY